MTPAELKAKCKLYEDAVTRKGYASSKVFFTINWLYDNSAVASVAYRTGANAPEKSEFFSCDLEKGWSSLFVQVERYIDGLKSVEDVKKAEFVAAVGRLIDQGRDIGIEVDYLNPLTQMMEKLSSNIITEQLPF